MTNELNIEFERRTYRAYLMVLIELGHHTCSMQTTTTTHPSFFFELASIKYYLPVVRVLLLRYLFAMKSSPRLVLVLVVNTIICYYLCHKTIGC